MTSFYRKIDAPRFHKIATGTDGWASNVMDNFVSLWEHRPVIKAYHSSTQAIAHNTTTTLAFDTIRYTDGYGESFTDSPTNTELTVTRDGLFYVCVNVDWQDSVFGERTVSVMNGATTLASEYQKPVDTSGVGYCSQALSCGVALLAGSTIKVKVRQTSGSTLDINPGSSTGFDKCELGLIWIGETNSI